MPFLFGSSKPLGARSVSMSLSKPRRGLDLGVCLPPVRCVAAIFFQAIHADIHRLPSPRSTADVLRPENAAEKGAGRTFRCCVRSFDHTVRARKIIEPRFYSHRSASPGPTITIEKRPRKLAQWTQAPMAGRRVCSKNGRKHIFTLR